MVKSAGWDRRLPGLTPPRCDASPGLSLPPTTREPSWPRSPWPLWGSSDRALRSSPVAAALPTPHVCRLPPVRTSLNVSTLPPAWRHTGRGSPQGHDQKPARTPRTRTQPRDSGWCLLRSRHSQATVEAKVAAGTGGDGRGREGSCSQRQVCAPAATRRTPRSRRRTAERPSADPSWALRSWSSPWGLVLS